MTAAERFREDELFRDPPVEFRSLPFWAWNDRLNNDEVASQIRSMKDHGMGGFFMHSRDGLETPYLGKEWLEATSIAIKTAREEGLTAWLYDEDRWPSGSAGGAVPALGDAYRAKALTMEILDGSYEPAGDVVAIFQASVRDLDFLGGVRLDPLVPQAAEAGRSFLVFRIEVAGPDEWFNGESPPDNMNPEAVEAFLERGYKPYLAAVGESFGSIVPGIFTDEPSVHDRHSRYTVGRGWIPWTYGFADFFASRRGYDPFDDIALVFFDGPGQARIRHDYWRTIADMFSETFTRRLGDWCAKNKLQFTGHFLWENQLGTATRTSGALMPHYRFQHIPGIDILCEQIEETITVKQCTSVAHQYGRGRVLSETYGCVGWEFTFEGQKWLGDWQFVMGVNLRCQHLALYSLKGCRKRDYPPVFNYNTSWWKHNKIIEDYFARLSAVLTRGEPVRDILVLHPSSTAWCLLGTEPRGAASRETDRNLPMVNALGDDFNRFIRAILGLHYDFDLGDETIMAETGRVEGGFLFVNLAAYRLVVMPPMVSMFKSTLSLLWEFLNEGGRLIAIRPYATLLEGIPSIELEALFSHSNTILAEDPSAALPMIESVIPRQVSLRNPYLVEDPEILCMYRRQDDGGSILFAVNTDRRRGREIVVEIDREGAVEELDPLSGAVHRLDVSISGGKTRFHADFGPAGSRLYRMDFGTTQATSSGSAPSLFSQSRNFLTNPPILAAFGPRVRFRRTEPNALVLDRCSFRLSGSGWSEEMEVWRAQKEIRSSLGMKQVYYNGLEQRYRWSSLPHPNDGTPVSFRFRFAVKAVPAGQAFLVVESPIDYQIVLNGVDVPPRAEGWFLDKSFERIRLPALAMGENVITLSCGYRNGMEVEDCFIIGDFSVDRERAIDTEPGDLRFGDWCLQGYPHYCGSIVYLFEFTRPIGNAFLHLGDFSAVTVEIRVNGKTAGHVPWRGVEDIDLGGFVQDGKNTLEIEVVGSPRNLLGPFHLARGKVYFNEWSAFRPEGSDYTDDYILQPYGLFGQITLSRNRSTVFGED